MQNVTSAFSQSWTEQAYGDDVLKIVFSDKTSVFKLMDFSEADYAVFELNLSLIFAAFVLCFPPHVHKTLINLDRSCKHILRKRENSPHCVSLTLVSCYICC